MKKLRLDDLLVETFEAGVDGGRGFGTVQAHQDTSECDNLDSQASRMSDCSYGSALGGCGATEPCACATWTCADTCERYNGCNNYSGPHAC